jgi:hypothetical protein
MIGSECSRNLNDKEGLYKVVDGREMAFSDRML